MPLLKKKRPPTPAQQQQHTQQSSSSNSTNSPSRRDSSTASSILSQASTATRSTLRKSRYSVHSIYNSATSSKGNGAGTNENDNQCVECNLSPYRQGSLFCGITCLNRTRAKAPCLILLKTSHPTYQNVAALFAKTWSHGTPVPSVERIYAIISTERITRRYNTYRDQIESNRKFLESTNNSRPGNEQPRWHGTLCSCNLTAVESDGKLCTARACSLCNIIQVSYDISYSGVKWGRYGKGIYTTYTSSKASDYSKNAQDSPLKALLLNDVAIGKGILMSTDSPRLTGPPSGYDSVLGVPGKRLRRGGAPSGLNYDETVVYKNEAIRPVYLLLYRA